MRRLVAIELERPTDWIERRGSLAILTIGPLKFAVNTADDASFAFWIRLWHWAWFWGIERAPAPDELAKPWGDL